MEFSLEDLSRFIGKLKETPNGCWEYQGGKHKDGYGLFFLGWKSHLAHRVSFELFKGPLGDLQALHSCDNPPCCNPRHLFAGTHQDNMKDRDAKGRGYDRSGENNGRAKIGWPQARAIRVLKEEHRATTDELCCLFGVSRHIVQSILRNETWKE